MLSIHLTYPRGMHGSVSKNGWRMCRVCSGSCVCMHPWRCTDAELYWLSTQAQRRSHRFLNQSSPPPYEILYREKLLLGGRLMLIRRMTSESRCSHPGLSCCHHLTYDLLLSMPGLSADTLVRTVLSNNLQSSPRLRQIGGGHRKKIMLEYIGPSPEKNPPPKWVMLNGTKPLLHQVTDDAD